MTIAQKHGQPTLPIIALLGQGWVNKNQITNISDDSWKQQHSLDLELEQGLLKNIQLLLFDTSLSEQFTEYVTNTL